MLLRLPGETAGGSKSSVFLGMDIQEHGWARSRDLGNPQEEGMKGAPSGST